MIGRKGERSGDADVNAPKLDMLKYVDREFGRLLVSDKSLDEMNARLDRVLQAVEGFYASLDSDNRMQFRTDYSDFVVTRFRLPPQYVVTKQTRLIERLHEAAKCSTV